MQLLEEQSSIHTQYWKRRRDVNSTPLTHNRKSNFCDRVREEMTSLHLLLLQLISQKDNQPHQWHFYSIIYFCVQWTSKDPSFQERISYWAIFISHERMSPCVTNLPPCPMSCTPHLRTRKAPRRDQSWEMMQHDVSVLPCCLLLPTRVLQLAASPALPKPTESHYQLLHNRAGAWEVHFSHPRALPRRGVTLTLCFPTSAFTTQSFEDFQYHNEDLGLDTAFSRKTAWGKSPNNSLILQTQNRGKG